jgi:hypothetical protein
MKTWVRIAWAPAVAIFAVACATTGCATTPVPADKLARTHQAVEHAEAMHAEADPRAAVHLRLAKQNLEQARLQMRNGDNKKATWYLTRAEADAEAALYLAHARAAKVDAEKTIDAIRQATQMLQQGGTGS